MIDSKTTNAVRQVLMNELGLTREAVRQEMQTIVEAEAVKVVNRLVNEGTLRRLVHDEFVKAAYVRGYGQSKSLHGIIASAAREAAERFVRDRIRVLPAPADVDEGDAA